MKRAFLLAILFAAPASAFAQREVIEPTACLVAVSPSQLKRVPVFLQATPTDSASKVILPSADFFVQSVATRIREIVGGSDSILPAGDSIVSWYSLAGEIIVTVKPSGQFAWRTAEWSLREDSIERSALRLLSRAVADVSQKGEWIQWPEGVVRDSIAFGLSFVNPRVTKSGAIVPVTARQPIAAFTIGMGRETPVDYKSPPHISYPEKARSLGMIGGVRFNYTVKADGRIDENSIREIADPRVARLEPDLREAYRSFVRAVRNALKGAVYIPATIGGCPMAQTVENEFKFRLDQ